ncbi:MAG: hypothetical protein DSZ30_05170 [Aquificaceae bacterium]|nr:MAG: hypothetical protein DSZ30_05170 [Aquificaceae bacterium]
MVKDNTIPSVSFATLSKRVGITTPYSRIKQELGGYLLPSTPFMGLLRAINFKLPRGAWVSLRPFLVLSSLI